MNSSLGYWFTSTYLENANPFSAVSIRLETWELNSHPSLEEETHQRCCKDSKLRGSKPLEKSKLLNFSEKKHNFVLNFPRK